jgi:hypothetical protein
LKATTTTNHRLAVLADRPAHHCGSRRRPEANHHAARLLRLHILSGEQLYDEMVTIIGGTSSFMNEVIVKHCRFRSGETPANFVVSSGSGYAKVIMEHNGNVGNVPVANTYRYWNDGSLSTYDPDSP